MGGVQEAGILLRRGELQDLVPGQHEFPDQVHQFIQQAHIDTNVAVGKGRDACFRLDLQSFLHGGGLGCTLFHQDFTEAAVIPVVLELQCLIDFLRISLAGLHQYFAQGQSGSEIDHFTWARDRVHLHSSGRG